MINIYDNSNIFYHCTPNYNVKNILIEGLKIKSIPNWYCRKHPYIWISTVPFYDFFSEKDGTGYYQYSLLEIDLKDFSNDKFRKKFNTQLWTEDMWQIKIFENIPENRIKKSKIGRRLASKMCNQWGNIFKQKQLL
jgi:hypothetical protein